MSLRRISVVASLAAIATLAACHASITGGAEIDLLGDFAFTYAGGISGSYNAHGHIPATTGEQQLSDWASAEVPATGSVVNVSSAMPRSATTHDFVYITIRRRTVGTETLTGCVTNCSSFYIMFGAPNVGSTGFYVQECILQAGSFTITAKTDKTVTGTFSGTGKCTGPTGTQTSFTVTNGTFYAPILTSVD